MKYMKYVFMLLVCVLFGYIIAGLNILPKDDIDHRSVCYEYEEATWMYLSDGSKTKIDDLGKYKNVVALETVLPASIDNQVTSFCFRGNDSKVYIDDELRFEYAIKETRWFGKISPECYIMVPISSEDAGKTLRIDLGYSEGILYQSYIGTELGIWMHILRNYVGEIAVALFTLVLGGLTILISIIYGAIRRKKIDIGYLGVGVSLAAIWLAVNSVYRQIFFSNLAIADDFPFLMVMLIPFPFLIYMDKIQEKRFTKVYTAACVILAVIDATCCTLYVLGVKELMDTFIFVALACFGCIIAVILSFAIDMRLGKISSYKFVAFGLFGAFTSAIVQLVTYFVRAGIFSGSYLALGLICLLVGAAIHTVRNLFSIEKDKRAAEMASDAKGKFLAQMSHEIRTPINAVLGMDEMILRESKESSIREYAMDIQNAGKNLLSLINDILDISKIESGKMDILPVEYDVSSMMNDTMNMIYHKAKAKDLYATIEADENIPSRLIGDDIRIRQVLINILGNAIKYTNEGGVTLGVSIKDINETHVTLHFEVRDTGIGIKEEDLPKLYARFERIEETRNRNVEGTGLGMNISLQLLELMNSKLGVESVYGEGSCFFFDLEQKIVDDTPIGDLSDRIRKQEEEYTYETTFVAASADILVVDDNSVNRKVVRNLLKDVGINVFEADSGEKCLEMVCDKKYDIIFLDHMMPGLDGIQTLKLFPSVVENKNVHTPVIALTANAVTGAKEMYLAAGFDGFLSKPIIYSRLEETILRFLPEEKVMPVTVNHDNKNHDENSEEKTKLIEAIPELNMEYALMVNSNINILFDTVVSLSQMMESDASELGKYKTSLTKISTADDESVKQYRIKVHSMKTSASMVGLMNLAGMARLLELAALEADIDTIEKIHDVFIKEWLRNKNVIQDILAEYLKKSDACDDEKIDLNVDILHEQLELLLTAVENVDVDKADEIVELLKGFNYPGEIESSMSNVYTAVVNLDESALAEAISTIKPLWES